MPEPAPSEIRVAATPSDPAQPTAETSYFLGISLTDVKPFREAKNISFCGPDGKPAQWTVLLGDNGMGKTTLLQCLAGVGFEGFNVDEHGPGSRWGNDFMGASSMLREGAKELSVEWSLLKSAGVAEKGSVWTLRLRLDAGSVTWGRTPQWNSTKSKDSLDRSCTVFAYGALRRLSMGSLEETRDPDCAATLFDDNETLTNAEEWLLQADYAAEKSRAPKARERVQKIISVLLQLLPDIERIEINPRGIRTPRAEAKTPFGWVPLRELSTGYRSVIAWVTDFASRLLDLYPDAQNPLQMPAVVLVDQIDLYLHPKWQRDVMQRLSQLFPNTQFIVTAHSPLIVQAAPGAKILVLKRVGDEVKVIDNAEDVRGWRADQLLASDLFDNQPLRDAKTEELLKKRRDLLAKSELTPEDEKEVKRLDTAIGELPFGETPEQAKIMEILREAAALEKR